LVIYKLAAINRQPRLNDKMKINLKIIVAFLLILSSCGDARIEMISKKSGLKLPENYNVIQNSTDGVGADFEVNVVLKFDEKSFLALTKQTDSLIRVNPSWTKNSTEINYIEKSNAETESIEIDLKNKTLKYVAVHL
jgi:hypothetical protein